MKSANLMPFMKNGNGCTDFTAIRKVCFKRFSKSVHKVSRISLRSGSSLAIWLNFSSILQLVAT